MNIGRACTFLALCLTAAVRGLAQQDSSAHILLGPIFGMEYGLERERIPVYGFFPDCGEFMSGNARIISGGALLSLPSLFSDRLGLSFTAALSYSAGMLAGSPADEVVIVDGTRVIRLEREYRLEHEFLRVGLDLLGIFRPFGHLELGAGISTAYIPSISFQQTDNIIGPDDFAFPGGRTSREMLDGPQLRSAGVQFGPKLHIAYRLPMGRRIWMQPALTAGADLLSLVEQEAWRRVSLGGRLSILFDLSREPAPPPPPKVIPRLSAAIDLYGVDEDQRPQPVAAVMVKEELYRQNMPLLPLLHFDRNAASLPERYARLTRAGADTFTLESVGAMDLLEMQHHILDVVGWRLRNDTSTTITLIGSTSREEPPTLARTRAETVRDYLEQTWGIDHSRIAIGETGGHVQRSSEATDDGRADNRRVEIVSRSRDIIAPVVAEQVVREFNPPMIRILPTYDVEAGLMNWTITISQGSNIITRYSYRESAGGTEPEFVWSIIGDHIDSALAPLVAELMVQDSTGAVATARAEVPLVLTKQLTVRDGRVEHSGNYERIGHTLVAFSYNSSELTSQQESAIAAMAGEIRDGAVITIVGYTDRIGDERYNMGLSLNRASRIAEALGTILKERGVRGVTIRTNGAGIETERFSNDLPEGRALSRGATIVIEQERLPGDARR